MTRGLALEVAAEGIRVNAVRPGLIHTDIHALGGEPGRVDRIAPALPMGRGGRPEEIAESILFLLSPASSYTTGAFLDASTFNLQCKGAGLVASTAALKNKRPSPKTRSSADHSAAACSGSAGMASVGVGAGVAVGCGSRVGRARRQRIISSA